MIEVKIMKKTMLMLVLLAFTGSTLAADDPVITPAKISLEEVNGDIFMRESMSKTTHEDGHTTLDVTSLTSSDKKFASGMYRSERPAPRLQSPTV